MEVGQEVEVDAAEVTRHDGAEEQPAEAGWWLGGQHEVTQRDPPRGGERA